MRANAGDGNTSAWVNTTFTTPLCDPEDMGEITYQLNDSYGDGWNGNAIEIVAPNGLVVETEPRLLKQLQAPTLMELSSLLTCFQLLDKAW